MDKFNGLPNPHFEMKAEITQKERDNLIHFNTKKFWHCWFDPKTNSLYNEYCIKVLENASDYLISIGMINDKLELIRDFEPE